MANPAYDNASQQRILRLLLNLSGHELHGLAPKDLAESLQVSPGTITRDVHNLREMGLAEVIQETGRIRLGPKAVQISLAYMTAMDTHDQRFKDLKNRFEGRG